MNNTRTSERWKEIAGFPGYFVSDLGRVRGRRGTILAGCTNDHGYRLVLLYDRRHQQKMRAVHRLVLEAFRGRCPRGKEACHYPDPAKTNNALSNLMWGTREENLSHRKGDR